MLMIFIAVPQRSVHIIGYLERSQQEAIRRMKLHPNLKLYTLLVWAMNERTTGAHENKEPAENITVSGGHNTKKQQMDFNEFLRGK